MPGAMGQARKVTAEDYLAAELRAPVNHEFVDGHVYAKGVPATATTSSRATSSRLCMHTCPSAARSSWRI
jgi:hypothetical protein